MANNIDVVEQNPFRIRFTFGVPWFFFEFFTGVALNCTSDTVYLRTGFSTANDEVIANGTVEFTEVENGNILRLVILHPFDDCVYE